MAWFLMKRRHFDISTLPCPVYVNAALAVLGFVSLAHSAVQLLLQHEQHPS